MFFIVKQHQLTCSLLGVSSRECRAAEIARLYVQKRVSGHKIWLPSPIISLSAGSIPVIFSSLSLPEKKVSSFTSASYLLCGQTPQ